MGRGSALLHEQNYKTPLNLVLSLLTLSQRDSLDLGSDLSAALSLSPPFLTPLLAPLPPVEVSMWNVAGFIVNFVRVFSGVPATSSVEPTGEPRQLKKYSCWTFKLGDRVKVQLLLLNSSFFHIIERGFQHTNPHSDSV